MMQLGKHLAIWGSILQLGIVVGFAATLVQIARAVGVIAPSEPPPPEVTAAVVTSFHVMGIGLILGIIGGVLTLAALFGCRYRAPWLHPILSILSLFWLASSPLVGLAMIGYLFFDRRSFYRVSESPDPSLANTPLSSA